MYAFFNPNPIGANVGDCTIRAISKAMNMTWEDTYAGLSLEGYMMADMPSANNVWGAYLRRHGYKRYLVDDHGQDRYTIEDFCVDHPGGTYIVCLQGHVVCVQDGVYYDSWDSGSRSPLYYWQKETNENK